MQVASEFRNIAARELRSCVEPTPTYCIPLSGYIVLMVIGWTLYFRIFFKKSAYYRTRTDLHSSEREQAGT